MMADRTFWVESEQAGRPVLMAVTADDSVQDLFLDTGVLGVPIKEYPPCKGCAAMDTCLNSVWEDGQRMGGPTTADAYPSVVYPCRTCGDMVIFHKSHGAVLPISVECPRGRGVLNSAFDCSGCSVRKDSLPDFKPKTTAHHLTAEALVMDFLPYIIDRFPQAWAKLSPAEVTSCGLAWKERIIWGLESGDPEQVVLSFLWDFTERPRLGDLWMVMGVSERKFIRRVLVGMAKQALQRVA